MHTYIKYELYYCWALKYCVVLQKGGEGGISDVNYTAKAAVAALEKEMSSEGKIKTGPTMRTCAPELLLHRSKIVKDYQSKNL